MHQRNQGVCKARNAGVARAKGSLILPLDADDTIAPTSLGKAAEAFSLNDRRAVVSAGYRHTDGGGGRGLCETFPRAALLRRNQSVVASLFRKELWARVGGFAERFSRLALEDWDFWLSVYEVNPNVLILPEPLSHYRRHGPSRNGQVWLRRVSKTLILLRHWRPCLAHPSDLRVALSARWLRIFPGLSKAGEA